MGDQRTRQGSRSLQILQGGEAQCGKAIELGRKDVGWWEVEVLSVSMRTCSTLRTSTHNSEEALT